ncbi:MAG TPA: DUF4982 domain-containing protein, partial [Chitinophagaceae bacterium]|nr:DUF4982 domain-containing protein [Chitinophagaceae bacterium]
YQAHWRPDFPMAHILPHWNWPERVDSIVPVHVYTSGDEAELFLNGRSLGRKKMRPGQDFRLVWDSVRYEPGEVRVVAYKQGRVWARDTVRTTGAPSTLALAADQVRVAGNGRDLVYVKLMVQDASGRTVPRSHPVIHFSLEGPGEIVATDNGDATSFVSFQSPVRPAYNGMALVIVRAREGERGTLVVKASSPGLAPAVTKIQVN